MTGEFLINKSGYKMHFPATSLVINQCPILVKPCKFHNFKSLLVDNFHKVLHFTLSIALRGHLIPHTLKTFIPHLHVTAVLIVKAVLVVLLFLLLLLVGWIVLLLDGLGVGWVVVVGLLFLILLGDVLVLLVWVVVVWVLRRFFHYFSCLLYLLISR